MKTEDILKLKDAGFTNEDIIKFASAYDATMVPEAPQDPPVSLETEKTPESSPAWVNSLSSQIEALTRTIQATNARSVNIPKPEIKDPAQILGDVLNAAANTERK